jgi:hypothetical protein
MLSALLGLACDNYTTILKNEDEDWFDEIILCNYFVSFLENKQISELFNINLTLNDINLLLAACLVEFLSHNNLQLKLIVQKINTYRIAQNFKYHFDQSLYVNELKPFNLF